MKVASVVFKEEDYKEITHNPGALLEKIGSWLRTGQKNQVKVLVFPALIGNLYSPEASENTTSFLEEVLNLSLNFRDMAICPGSWWEKEQNKDKQGPVVYHSSALIRNGSILCEQRQLYLARWERELGLTRGSELSTCSLEEFSVCIQLATDLFYPQVSRYAALSGVNLVLAPSAIKGPPSFPRQMSGLWQQVQQNLFFGLESGFTGSFVGQEFHTKSIIHAPLVITSSEDGFVRKESSFPDKSLLIADLCLIEREKALKSFNPMTQLNPKFYQQDIQVI